MALHSTIGLTKALYAHSLDLAKQVRRLRRRKFRVLFSLVVTSFTRSFQRKSCERLMPKYLVVLFITWDQALLLLFFCTSLPTSFSLCVTNVTGLLTPFSGLLQNDLFEAEIWREVFSNNIIVTLVIQGFQGLHTVPKTPENLRICPLLPLKWSWTRITLSVYSIVIFTIVFDLTFTKTFVIDPPFLKIMTTMKKAPFYLTISILISTDLQLLTYIHVWRAIWLLMYGI